MELITKEELKETTFFNSACLTLNTLDAALIQKRFSSAAEAVVIFNRLNVYLEVISEFLGRSYKWTRTDEYCGICSSDESDWLYKVERKC